MVVQAVGARDQLPERSRPGEPSLQIKLFGSGVVEGSAADADHAVGDLQQLAELLRIADHLVKGLPTLVVVGGGQDKLLDLLKLVDPEDALGIAAVRTDLWQK